MKISCSRKHTPDPVSSWGTLALGFVDEARTTVWQRNTTASLYASVLKLTSLDENMVQLIEDRGGNLRNNIKSAEVND